jgi:ElaB/YqjD/DUF883 family membrane-anchored ribosome-binding protein
VDREEGISFFSGNSHPQGESIMERKTSQNYRSGKQGTADDPNSNTSALTASSAETFGSDDSNGLSENLSPTPDASSPNSPNYGSNTFNQDIESLKADLASLKESIAALTSSTASSTMDMATEAAAKVEEKVSDTANLIAEKSSDMASAATQSAKSLSVEMEDITRRNPLAALAGAVVLGLLLGMASRGRS